MKRVQEHLQQRTQSFEVATFMNFLRDTALSPAQRLAFVPGVAPLVMGCADLERSLRDGRGMETAPETPGENLLWERYLEVLRALEPESAVDFNSLQQLLWGRDCGPARQTLQKLIQLAMNASPGGRQVLILALEAMGRVTGESLRRTAREFEALSGRKLSSADSLLEVLGRRTGEVELPPELEQEGVVLLDEAFALVTDMTDQLLAYARRRLELRATSERERIASQTFLEFGNGRLQAMGQAVGFGEADIQTVRRFFTFMCSPWGEQLIGTTPIWRSDITDDHTPFEFSLALEGSRPEIRFLIEAQGTRANPTTLQSSWHDGLLLNHRLHREFGVPLERFARVQALFEPKVPSLRFSLWHAFCLKPGGEPEFKVYLNPQARGPEQANALVKEALERLGFSRAWRCLSEVAMRRGEKDQLVYFSLDLSAHHAARIKVYIAHREANCEDINAVLSQAKEYVPGEAHAFCQAVMQREGVFQGSRATLTCLAFTSDADERPYSVTLHCPIRSYAMHDQDAMERIGAILAPESHALLERAVRTLANRPLDEGLGLIQWASMRRQGGMARTTFYLATEAYGMVAPQVLPLVAPGQGLAGGERQAGVVRKTA